MSLKTRTITGLIFGAVMISATLAHAYSCAILFLLIGICCLWEYAGLVFAKDSPPVFDNFRKLLTIFLGMLPAFMVINTELGLLPLLTDYIFWAFPIFFSLFIFELFAKSAKPFENIGFILLGCLYIGIPMALVEAICLSSETVGNQLILAMLLIVWASDSFAYLIGSRIGKTKLLPRISPGKTWEGTIGGWIGGIGFGALCFVLFPSLNYNIGQWLILGAVGSVFGVLGDLIESMLKRSLNIKDSGTILPGHGGFLDRFDAFIFVVPFIAFTLIFLFKDGRFIVWF